MEACGSKEWHREEAFVCWTWWATELNLTVHHHDVHKILREHHLPTSAEFIHIIIVRTFPLIPTWESMKDNRMSWCTVSNAADNSNYKEHSMTFIDSTNIVIVNSQECSFSTVSLSVHWLHGIKQVIFLQLAWIPLPFPFSIFCGGSISLGVVGWLMSSCTCVDRQNIDEMSYGWGNVSNYVFKQRCWYSIKRQLAFDVVLIIDVILATVACCKMLPELGHFIFIILFNDWLVMF